MSAHKQPLTFAQFMQGGLILFKLADLITWSWFWVFLPIYISLAVIMLEGAVEAIMDFCKKHK